jgi:hypothetical protein
MAQKGLELDVSEYNAIREEFRRALWEIEKSIILTGDSFDLAWTSQNHMPVSTMAIYLERAAEDLRRLFSIHKAIQKGTPANEAEWPTSPITEPTP